MRIRACSSTRREVVPPIVERQGRTTRRGARRTRAVVHIDFLGVIFAENPGFFPAWSSDRSRALFSTNSARPYEKSHAIHTIVTEKTWRTPGLHHPGVYRRTDDSAIERGTLESISRLDLDPQMIKTKLYVL